MCCSVWKCPILLCAVVIYLKIDMCLYIRFKGCRNDPVAKAYHSFWQDVSLLDRKKIVYDESMILWKTKWNLNRFSISETRTGEVVGRLYIRMDMMAWCLSKSQAKRTASALPLRVRCCQTTACCCMMTDPFTHRQSPVFVNEVTSLLPLFASDLGSAEISAPLTSVNPRTGSFSSSSLLSSSSSSSTTIDGSSNSMLASRSVSLLLRRPRVNVEGGAITVTESMLMVDDLLDCCCCCRCLLRKQAAELQATTGSALSLPVSTEKTIHARYQKPLVWIADVQGMSPLWLNTESFTLSLWYKPVR